MKWMNRLTVLALVCVNTAAIGQVEEQDFRIRARFRTPNDGQWAADQSVGRAEFRVQSRFLHVYYGGVSRNDEYKFNVQIDFRGVSGFAQEFATSQYNSDYDVYINDGFVGRVFMSAIDTGLAELTYDSRHAQLPDLPLPDGFPDPVDVFDLVSVYFASGAEPAIGDAAILATPIFESELVEEFARGDANFDGKVDEDDYAILASNYDPFYRLGDHIGPLAGDFTGDNLSDLADYELMAANWTDSHDIPPEPQAVIGICDADLVPDGELNFFDVSAFLSSFASLDPAADINGDGNFNFFDVSSFLTLLSSGCP